MFYEDSKSKSFSAIKQFCRNRDRVDLYRPLVLLHRRVVVPRSWLPLYWQCKYTPMVDHLKQLAFLMGIVSLIGPKATLVFFSKKQRLVGSGCYFGGFLLIIIGWFLFTTVGFGL